MPWLSEHTSFPALGRPVRAAFQAPRTGSQTGGRTGVHNKRLKLSKPNRGARPGAAIDRLRSLAACRCAAHVLSYENVSAPPHRDRRANLTGVLALASVPTQRHL